MTAAAATRSREQPVTFTSAGHLLFGILHQPEVDEPERPTVVCLHGWSGTRLGPHRMFVKYARCLAAAGYPCLRFDFRGRGDSEGDLESASLATMVDDVHAACEWLAEKRPGGRVVLTGICSGGEVAVGAAGVHPSIAGLILWSAPIFSAGESVQREVRKRASHLREYAAKLFRPQTYAKLLSGKLQGGLILKVLFGKRSAAPATQMGANWREQSLDRFRQFGGQILFVYGSNDPVTDEATAWYFPLCDEAGIPWESHVVDGANHSYYALDWESEVIDRSRQWLDDCFALSPATGS